MSLNVWSGGLILFPMEITLQVYTSHAISITRILVPGGGEGMVARGRRTLVEGTKRLESDGMLGVCCELR